MALNENLADFFATPQIGLDSIAASPTPAPQRPRPETQPRQTAPELSTRTKWADIAAKPEFKNLTPEKQAEARAAYFDHFIAPHAGQQAKALRDEFLASGKKEERTWSEAATDTAVQLAEGVNTIFGAVPNLVAPESGAAEFFNKNAEFWRKKQSQSLRDRTAAADQAITKAGDDGVIAQITEAASQYFSDPALAARFVTTNLPSMIPGIGAAKVAQAAAIAKGASAAKVASVATTAAGGVNAVLNAGGARGEAFEDIKRTLIEQGMSPQEAEQRAIEDSRVVAAVGGAAGFVSGKIGLEKALVGGSGKGGARATAGAFTRELAGEQIEEVSPKLTTNVQAGKYDNRSIGQDVGRTIVETAIGSGPGAVVAGVMGRNAGAAQGQAPVAQSQPTAADVTPDGRLETNGTDHSLERDAPVLSAMHEAGMQPDDAPAADVATPGGNAQPLAQTITPAEPAVPNVLPSQAAADSIVRQVAERAGIPLETVLPTTRAPTAEVQQGSEPQDALMSFPGSQPGEFEAFGEAVADQDVLDFAAGRYQQLRTKRDGDTQPVMTDNGFEDGDIPGVPLSAQEAREMAALESARGDADALRAFYGLERPAAPPAGADISTRTDDELRQQMRNAGSRGVQRLIAENLQRRQAQASEMPATLPLDVQSTSQLDAAPPAFNANDAGYTRPDAAPDADIAALEAIYDFGREDAVRDGRRDDLAGAVHPFRRVPVSALRGVADIAEAFGKRVVGFAVDPGVLSKDFGSFNGVTWPRGAGNRIFINQDADRPHLAVLGHEIAHQMAKTRPELYARMVEAIRPYIDQREYLTTFSRTSVASGSVSDGMTREQKGAAVREEFIGEVLSDGFMDPDFWRALGAKNKQLLAQVQAFVGRLIEKVMSTVGYTRRTEQYLTDYQRVMQIAGEVMADYGMDQTRLNAAAGIPTFMFAGERAQTADTQALAEAKQRLESGQDTEQVRRATGWFQGVDGKWRFEFDDSRARLTTPFRLGENKTWGEVHSGNGPDMALASLIDHPTLFTTYPEFRGLTVGVQSGKGASFDTETGVIRIGEGVRMGDVLSKLLHEIQHAVQTKEGFAKGWNRDVELTPAMRQRVMENIAADGGDPDEAAAFVDGQIGRELTYQWAAGEVEARNVQSRHALTAEQRLNVPPSQTADVPERSQIVVIGAAPISASQSDFSPRVHRTYAKRWRGTANRDLGLDDLDDR